MSVSWPSALHCHPDPCLTHCSPGSIIPQSNPMTLDEYTPHQYWSASLILVVPLAVGTHDEQRACSLSIMMSRVRCVSVRCDCVERHTRGRGGRGEGGCLVYRGVVVAVVAKATHSAACMGMGSIRIASHHACHGQPCLPVITNHHACHGPP